MVAVRGRWSCSEEDMVEKLFIKAAQAKKVETVGTTLLMLWNNRNKVVHDHFSQSPIGIVR